MTWTHNLKAQETEGLQEKSSAFLALPEADEDLVHFHLLFSKL